MVDVLVLLLICRMIIAISKDLSPFEIDVPDVLHLKSSRVSLLGFIRHCVHNAVNSQKRGAGREREWSNRAMHYEFFSSKIIERKKHQLAIEQSRNNEWMKRRSCCGVWPPRRITLVCQAGEEKVVGIVSVGLC